MKGQRIRVKRRMMYDGGGRRDGKKLRRVEAKKVRRKEGREDERIRGWMDNWLIELIGLNSLEAGRQGSWEGERIKEKG
jgi:hypothetical protein